MRNVRNFWNVEAWLLFMSVALLGSWVYAADCPEPMANPDCSVGCKLSVSWCHWHSAGHGEVWSGQAFPAAIYHALEWEGGVCSKNPAGQGTLLDRVTVFQHGDCNPICNAEPELEDYRTPGDATGDVLPNTVSDVFTECYGG